MTVPIIGEAQILIRAATKAFASEVEKDTGKAIDKATEGVEKKASISFEKVATIGGAALAGIGVALSKQGRELEKSQIALRQVIENSGKSFSDYEIRLAEATKIQAKYGHGAADVRDALTKLTLSTKSPDRALESLTLTSNIAALKNIDLADAAVLVGRIYAGNAKVLKQFGVDGVRATETTKNLKEATDAHAKAIRDLNTAQQRLSDLEAIQAGKAKLSVQDAIALRDARQGLADAQAETARTATDLGVAEQGVADAAAAGAANLGAVSDKVGGVAQEQAGTFIGKLEGIKTALGNISAEIGQTAGPAITGVGTALATLGGIISGVQAGIDIGLIPALGRAAVALIGPVGVAAAIAALGTAIYFFLFEGDKFTKWTNDIHDNIQEGITSFLEFINVIDTAEEKHSKAIQEANKRLGGGATVERKGGRTVVDLRTKHQGGSIPSFQAGGEVPILAQSGEFVMRRSAVNRVGLAGMNAINSGRGGAQTIIVPVILDGREIARVTANPMRDEMIRQNRGNVDVFGGRA